MDWKTILTSMDWKTILTSTVLAAIVVGLVSFVAAIINGYGLRRNVERAIQIENITKERARWRSKLRSRASEVYEAARAVITTSSALCA